MIEGAIIFSVKVEAYFEQRTGKRPSSKSGVLHPFMWWFGEVVLGQTFGKIGEPGIGL